MKSQTGTPAKAFLQAMGQEPAHELAYLEITNCLTLSAHNPVYHPRTGKMRVPTSRHVGDEPLYTARPLTSLAYYINFCTLVGLYDVCWLPSDWPIRCCCIPSFSLLVFFPFAHHAGDVRFHVVLVELFCPSGKCAIGGGVVSVTAVRTTQLKELPSLYLERFHHASVVAPALAVVEELFYGSTQGHHQAEGKGGPTGNRRYPA